MFYGLIGLGLILILIGWLTGIGILITLGIIAVVVGLILWVLGGVRGRGGPP